MHSRVRSGPTEITRGGRRSPLSGATPDAFEGSLWTDRDHLERTQEPIIRGHPGCIRGLALDRQRSLGADAGAHYQGPVAGHFRALRDRGSETRGPRLRDLLRPCNGVIFRISGLTATWSPWRPRSPPWTALRGTAMLSGLPQIRIGILMGTTKMGRLEAWWGKSSKEYTVPYIESPSKETVPESKLQSSGQCT
ncbi:hypothetical protein NDU88_004039 [Pleurodeles waltl]|uniref:Uncharacterized protein n=1 Tax=Pleurodeles waltl TaxID=8319 RepID=A0AAV7M604_PLEWA|nr:hypothetical protein NDU88_004039 [Pleurodeles waltl]